jgi:hypothetical protein
MTLRSPHLLYLGRGDEVAVFVACGHTTVVIPADAVAIDLLDRGPATPTKSDDASAASLTSAAGPALTDLVDNRRKVPLVQLRQPDPAIAPERQG